MHGVKKRTEKSMQHMLIRLLLSSVCTPEINSLLLDTIAVISKMILFFPLFCEAAICNHDVIT